MSSSVSSSSTKSYRPTRSLIVSKVSLDKDETQLFEDLSRDYPGVQRVSRNHDQNGIALGSIRVDFASEDIVSDILAEEVIYIRNKHHFIRPYYPLICYHCNNEGHIAAECPRSPISRGYLARLLEKQESGFETLINNFEKRWNARLLSMKTVPKSVTVEQLVPASHDLATVCQQINQQNALLQTKLMNIANRMHSMQPTVKN